MIDFRLDYWIMGDRFDYLIWFFRCLDFGTIAVVIVESFTHNSQIWVWFVSCHSRVDTRLNGVWFG